MKRNKARAKRRVKSILRKEGLRLEWGYKMVAVKRPPKRRRGKR